MTAISFNPSSFQNCANWYNKAKALKKAADMIRETYLVAYRNLDRGKCVRPVPGGVRVIVDMTKLDIDDLDQYPIAMLLMGYAMENIFRGIIITEMWLRDPKSVEVMNFADLQAPSKSSTSGYMPLIRHGLRRLLATDDMNVVFTDEEKDTMDKLDMFIVWGGRYAIPKEFDPSDPQGLKCLEPLEYPYQVLDSLYVKGMEKLIELCKRQGEKHSG